MMLDEASFARNQILPTHHVTHLNFRGGCYNAMILGNPCCTIAIGRIPKAQTTAQQQTECQQPFCGPLLENIIHLFLPD
jgi:hypothetical protein